MLGLDTLASAAVALTLAFVLGPVLARLAVHWFTGRGLTHLLVAARGMLLPVLATPILVQVLSLPIFFSIGIAVGTSQGIAVARWGARISGGWSPTLLGTLALGSSENAWLAQKALARGALVSTLGATLVEVVTTEALLASARIPSLMPRDSIGGRLVGSSALGLPLLIVGATAATFFSEVLVSLIFQRRPGQPN